jgi:hypothetical protein
LIHSEADPKKEKREADLQNRKQIRIDCVVASLLFYRSRRRRRCRKEEEEEVVSDLPCCLRFRGGA